ncbi:hypothetical protein B0H14DRAFT_2621013 [Mycena olivaceomarginata]|nr:hypothetical protein B0H14DRAFT_2621013 [Mycena olivaceomarginata]
MRVVLGDVDPLQKVHPKDLQWGQALYRVVPAKKLHEKYNARTKVDCIMLAIRSLGSPPASPGLKELGHEVLNIAICGNEGEENEAQGGPGGSNSSKATAAATQWKRTKPRDDDGTRDGSNFDQGNILPGKRARFDL